MPIGIASILIFLVLTILLSLGLYGIGEAIKKQAAKEKKRFFATLPQPGKFMFITVGGKLENTIENVLKWELDDQKRFRRTRSTKQLGFWEDQLGVIWIGLYGEIKIFKDWVWNEFGITPGGSEQNMGVKTRKADVSEFLHQFTYPVKVTNMELIGNNQADATALATIYMLDPEQTFFNTKDPIDTFIGIVQAGVKGWATRKTFDQLKEESEKTGSDSEFSRVLFDINGIELDPDTGDPKYDRPIEKGKLFQLLGIAVCSVVLQDLEEKGDTAVARREIVANELRGEANIKAAEKAARVKLIDAQATMDAAEREARAERIKLQQTLGYIASLPGGDKINKMRAATGKDSKLTTLVESKSDVDVTLPLPTAPAEIPEPERVK